MFSIDTETGFDKTVLINAAWGLGENVVQGTVDPDEYQVFKPLLGNPALMPIVEKKLGGKAQKMIYGPDENDPTINVRTSKARARELRAQRPGDPPPRPLGRHHRAALRPPDGHGMGEGRRDRRASSSFRRGPKPCSRAARPASSNPTRSSSKGKELLVGLGIGDAIAAGRVCVIEDARGHRALRRRRDPRRHRSPIPTGCRS